MTDRIYRFAKFELAVSEGELRTGDLVVRLQEKPLLLLSVLLDHPQRVVTREQLRERMWGSDTFVDYEQGINVAVKKVRDALGDSAENPKFIETIAKKGYRFLAPVEVGTDAVATANSSEPFRTATAANGPMISPRRGWIFAALGMGLLAAAGLWLLKVQRQNDSPARIRSLAVLPLRNLSPDPGQDYFADGVTEELTTNLAQSLPLRVISRTSVMRYKESKLPVTQIARELGVEAIVEGAVARSGKRVAVTVQLIDATQDRHLWAQKYDRDVGDLLGMEAELSQRIASQVGGTLSAQHVIKPAKSHPVDSQAYELCLLGRYHWNKRTARDLRRSVEYYQQSIARDPEYAPAYAGLANAYALLPEYDSVGFPENVAKATAAARRALELDDSLADAHTILAFVRLSGRDWVQSEPEFRRALELNPNDATAHHWYAFYFVFSERWSEALAEIEQARQLDPLSMIVHADEGAFLYDARRYDEARVRLREAIELGPDFGQPHETLALVELETGHGVEALKEARAGLTLDPTNPRTIGEAGYVLAVTGHRKEATELLKREKDWLQHGSASPSFVALIEIGLGQKDEAMDFISGGVHSPTGSAVQGLGQWHAFEELKLDPRYQKLTAQMQETTVGTAPSQRGSLTKR